MDTSDALIFLIVVAGRLGIPLFIPRFPLPAMIAAMLLDAADQTIFQNYTNLNLENYQSYDKSLDIYYLAIAYIATMRNWAHLFAFKTGRFLWYYRLAGVMLFEMLQWRPLLLIFPNTWEYFFDYYEGVKTRWNPLRMTVRHIVKAAAFIWIFIKLPQEYWIHVAQLDTTDFIKEDILGVPVETGWGEAISENLWVIPVVIVIGVALFFIGRTIYRRLPRGDWKFTFDANDHADAYALAPREALSTHAPRNWLIEKIILVGLMSAIFGKVLPNADVSNLQIIAGVAVIIIANSFISHWFAMRKTEWRNTFTEFVAMGAINFAIAVLYRLITPSFGATLHLPDLLFLILILTLVVTLYDHYRPMHDRRFANVTPQYGAEAVEKPA